jgi:hypothetical protein
MPTRLLDAATTERVRQAAHAARTIDPELRQALDLAYHGQAPTAAMLERLTAETLSWDYAAATMQRLSDLP